MQEETNTVIVIEERDDFGWVEISGLNKDALEAAKERVKRIIALPEKGETYKGKVKNITTFGAFIEIMPGKEGLLHISEITWERLTNVEDALKVGDEVEVKLLDIDRDGKLKLSRKVLLPKPEGYVERERTDRRPPRRDGGRDGGRDGRGNRDNRDNRDRRGDRRPPRENRD